MAKVKRSQSEGSGSDLNNSKMEKTMSNETPNVEVAASVKTVEVKKIEKKVKFYDLTDLMMKSQDIKLDFTPAGNFQEALQRISAGAKSEELTEMLNSILESKAISEAKKNQIPGGFASKKVVMEFIKSYRVVPQFAALVTLEKGDAGWKPQYDKQTDAILGQIKNIPFLMDSLKAIAATSTDEDGSEESDT
jgi:hypothetical protein